MKILKFGGTSVGSSKNINKVIAIVSKTSKNSTIAVVVSAVGGITDKLLKVAEKAIQKDKSYKIDIETIKGIHFKIVDELITNDKHKVVSKVLTDRFNELERLLDGIYLINELSPKTTDKLLSNGELLSSYIISEAMICKGLDVQLKNSQDLIVTNSQYTNASVNFNKTNANIKAFFNSGNKAITVIPGFISKSEDGELTTLGRGGSDYSAAIFAAALEVEELQIWTDVSGMYTTNPSLVKQALPIKEISYLEAVELSHFGAKVLYPPTGQPVLDKNIPIWIKNTLSPDDHGTLITKECINTPARPVKGISNINNIALLTLQGNGMVGIPGFSKRLFETLAQEKINIVLITQASSEHSICIAVSENDAKQAKSAVDITFENEISLHKIDPIIIERNLSIIALVGDNMKNHQGLSGKMFSTLGKNNVNIRAIAQGASERNISAVISSNDIKKALNTLHECFFEVETKQVNLFITGVGNVGERLVEQIKQQVNYVKENLHINLRIIGLSNSRTMIFDEDGINLLTWKKHLKNGEKASIEDFFATVKLLDKRNSVFVDVTANEDVADSYSKYLKESIAVVACNKIACSNDYDKYNNLKHLSRKYNAPFLFETNVGAGLPIIDSLNHLITSGDKVHSIQAVLSGSLNFVFNNYNETKTFYDVVKQAQEEGYTEPDPRIDLSGVDVARKILILARESGTKLNLEDIKNEPFLSDNALNSSSVDHFFDTLKQEESYYKDLYLKAKAKKCKLKYVAQFSEKNVKVGLEEIPEGHPFYNLEGKDNIVMYFTERYPVQPMIVKGAGAGADVTASGLFADIIRIANN